VPHTLSGGTNDAGVKYQKTDPALACVIKTFVLSLILDVKNKKKYYKIMSPASEWNIYKSDHIYSYKCDFFTNRAIVQ
jgi:hypothetical protein